MKDSDTAADIDGAYLYFFTSAGNTPAIPSQVQQVQGDIRYSSILQSLTRSWSKDRLLMKASGTRLLRVFQKQARLVRLRLSISHFARLARLQAGLHRTDLSCQELTFLPTHHVAVRARRARLRMLRGTIRSKSCRAHRRGISTESEQYRLEVRPDGIQMHSPYGRAPMLLRLAPTST